MERVPTGIPKFDELIEGGFPKGNNLLITGQPGTGKTIFGLHYLYNGAMNGENGLYISIDNSLDLLREQARQFGMDLVMLEKQKKILLMEVPITLRKLNLFDMIDKVKSTMGIERVVFDSLAAFSMNLDLFEIPLKYAGSIASSVSVGNMMQSYSSASNYLSKGEEDKKEAFYAGNSEERIISLILSELRHTGTTNLIITYEGGEENASVDGVSEFICDGVISLKSLAIGETLSRTLEIKKMRCTHIDGGIKSYDFGPQGLTILR